MDVVAQVTTKASSLCPPPSIEPHQNVRRIVYSECQIVLKVGCVTDLRAARCRAQ